MSNWKDPREWCRADWVLCGSLKVSRFVLYELRRGFEVEKWGKCKRSFRNREVSHPKTNPALFPSPGESES